MVGSTNPTLDIKKLNGNSVSTNAGDKDAGTQRVVIATDQTVIPVSDNGGSLTVDGTFWQATQPVSLASTTVTNTVAVSGPLTDTQLRATAVPVSGTVSVNTLPAGTNNIGDVDVLSVIPGVGATNLGKQTDSAAGATDTGVAILAIRDDTLTTLTPADGDYTGIRVDSTGRQWTSTKIDTALPAGANAIGSITNTSFTATQATGSNLHAVVDSGTITNLSQLNGTAISMNTGVRDAGTQRVTIATNDSVPVTGTFYQATQPVSLASIPAVTGAAANGAAVSGNPLLIAGYDGTTTRTLKTDATGNLLVNGVQDARQTGNIIAATTVVGPYSVNNRNVTTVTISGTYAGVSFVVEASDNGGTTWFGLQCINNATGQASSTWTPGTNATASYDAAVGGYTHIRVRATAWTSGTAAVGVSSQVFAYDPVVAALSQGLAATGTALVGNPVLIGGSDGTLARSISTDTTGAIKLAAETTKVIGTVNLAVGANAIGKLAANTGVDIGDVTLNNALGAGTSDANTVRVTESSAATSVVTSVASAVTSTMLKAANTARRGLTVFNSSTSVLYVNLGAMASSTAFTIKMLPDSYYEVPFSYNGQVNGIWAVANGAALVTEIS